MKNYLVLDIGGTFTKYALMNEEDILNKGKIKTVHTNFADLLTQIEKIYYKYKNKVYGIAISMPGVIDVEKGYAFHGGALRFIENCPIAEIIAKRFNLEVSVENDGKSAALGEVWKGKLQNIRNGIVMVLGTGVAGGIIANGELIKGEHFSAGEFSSIRTDGKQILNMDKTLGVAGSATNVIRNTALAIDKDPDTFNGEEMFSLLRQGQPTVTNLVVDYCNYIIGQIVNLQMILDPECIVISGGISRDPLLIDMLNESLKIFYKKDLLSESTGKHVRLVNSDLGNDSNLWGALYNHLKHRDIDSKKE